jgi:outer membrane protein assembly factor BamD
MALWAGLRLGAARAVAAGVLVAAAVAALGGCASNDAAKALNPDPPEKIYAEADALLSKGSYSDAARKFEDVDRYHPYSPEARRAIVMAAYAYYKAGKYQEAIESAKRYTTLHPGTKDAALAHHIIASANFDEIRDPSRDQTATRKAYAELKVLRERYPDSPYARQAENRIRIAEDVLAASEMTVGRYYLKNNNHVAAINRFKTVVTEYQSTAHVEEALYRLVEAYLAIGVVPEAQAAGAVLGHNFPNSSWYKNAYALLKSAGVGPQANPGSWITQTWRPGQQRQEPVPRKAPPGLPAPEDMPAPRTPAGDIPTASKPGRPPMGLAGAVQ